MAISIDLHGGVDVEDDYGNDLMMFSFCTLYDDGVRVGVVRDLVLTHDEFYAATDSGKLVFRVR